MNIQPTYEELNQKVKEFENRILQKKEDEDVLVWEHLFQKPMMNLLPAGFALYSEHFVLQKYNRTYADYVRTYTPFDAEQALGMDHFDYKPGARPFQEDWFRHVMQTRKSSTKYDLELGVRIDGKMCSSYWDSNLSPVMDSAGNLKGFLMCCIDVTERNLAKMTLQKKDGIASYIRNYEELKTVLKFIINLRTEDKRTLAEKFLLNLKHQLYPYLDKLKQSSLKSSQRSLVNNVEAKLNSIVSPFCQKLSSSYFGFTPMEIRVAGLVRDGKTSKEIAEILTISKDSIDFHRNNIRKKLNISNKKANLRSVLLSLCQSD
ncbi:MAG: PAS domain-containing protein [Desulfobacteraceae bacterium]|nr:PAS domain-containing protein [Desulfobacteraceae bacterium]